MEPDKKKKSVQGVEILEVWKDDSIEEDYCKFPK